MNLFLIRHGNEAAEKSRREKRRGEFCIGTEQEHRYAYIVFPSTSGGHGAEMVNNAQGAERERGWR